MFVCIGTDKVWSLACVIFYVWDLNGMNSVFEQLYYLSLSSQVLDNSEKWNTYSWTRNFWFLLVGNCQTISKTISFCWFWWLSLLEVWYLHIKNKKAVYWFVDLLHRNFLSRVPNLRGFAARMLFHAILTSSLLFFEFVTQSSSSSLLLLYIECFLWSHRAHCSHTA